MDIFDYPQNPSSIIDALIHQLSSSDPTVRTWAAIKLGHLADRKAVPALLTALKDDDADVRLEVVTALGLLHDQRAVPALFDLVVDWVPSDDESEGGMPGYVEVNAYRALWHLLPWSIEYIIQALTCTEWQTRARMSSNLLHHCFFLLRREPLSHATFLPDDYIIKANTPLGQTILQALNDPCSMVRVGAAQALRLFSSAVVHRALLQRLNDSEMSVRNAAADSLSYLPMTPEETMEQLRSPHPAVRAASTTFLHKLSADDAAQAILALLAESDPAIRIAVLTQLRYRVMKIIAQSSLSGRIAEQLVRLLDDPNSQIRLSAIRALAFTDKVEVVDRLVEFLQDQDDNNRQVVAWALGRLKGDHLISQLLPLLAHAQPSIRATALNLLARLDLTLDQLPNFDAMLQDLDVSVRCAAIGLLARRNDPHALGLLAKAMNDPDEVVAAYARRVHYEKSAITYELFDEMLNDPSPRLRSSAMLKMRARKDPRRVELCLRALRDNSPQIRIWAISQLADSDKEVFFSQLFDIMHDPSVWVLQNTALTLERQRDLRAIPLLLPFLRHKNRFLREGTLCALIAITEKSFGGDADAWENWWQVQAKNG